MEIPLHNQSCDLGLTPLGVSAEFGPLAIPLNYIHFKAFSTAPSTKPLFWHYQEFLGFQHSLSQICLEDNAVAYRTPASVDEDHTAIPNRGHILLQQFRHLWLLTGRTVLKRYPQM